MNRLSFLKTAALSAFAIIIGISGKSVNIFESLKKKIAKCKLSYAEYSDGRIEIYDSEKIKSSYGSPEYKELCDFWEMNKAKIRCEGSYSPENGNVSMTFMQIS